MSGTISVFEARELFAALAYARWPYYQGGKLDASHVVPWAEIQADWQRGPCYAWAEMMLVALANAGVEPFASLNRETRPTSEPGVGDSPPAMLGEERCSEPVSTDPSKHPSKPVLVPMDAERIAALRQTLELMECSPAIDDDAPIPTILRGILRDAGSDA
jgi:hypothetical protein